VSNYDHIVPLNDRTVERGRGCWNCTKYATGDLVVNHLEACKRKDTAAIIEKYGIVPAMPRLADQEKAVPTGTDARWVMADKMARTGVIGICMAGSQDDFVHFQTLCDKWVGRDGSSIATSGHAIDLLPEELAERVEEKAKKV